MTGKLNPKSIITHPLERLPFPINNGISQEQLNIEDKERVNLFPWKGQFSPQLVEVLLKYFGSKNESIIDPFMGSGTVIYEAGLLGFKAFGSEINPAAFSLANTYTLINKPLADRKHYIQNINIKIEQLVDTTLPLFTLQVENDSKCIFDKVVALYEGTPDYHERIILQALITLLDRRKSLVSPKKLIGEWNKLKQKILRFPYSETILQCDNRDARNLPHEDKTCGLVITSPPYINVFNYHQQYRSSMEGLGWDLLNVARSEIGSNRKHRSNRFLTVIQYILDMGDVFCELNRVLKDTGRAIFIVGRESNIKKTPFYNSVIINDLASQACGFELENRQERVFLNRFGMKIYEDILYFKITTKPLSREKLEKKLRDIASQTLIEALNRTPMESLKDLEDAINKVNIVERSPLYKKQIKEIHYTAHEG